MANGVIAVYDISKLEEGGLLFKSEINEYFHIDRVTSLEWAATKVNKNLKIMLVSGSLDGKMLFWDAADKLKFPKKGFILSTKSDIGNTKNHFSSRKIDNLSQ